MMRCCLAALITHAQHLFVRIIAIVYVVRSGPAIIDIVGFWVLQLYNLLSNTQELLASRSNLSNRSKVSWFLSCVFYVPVIVVKDEVTGYLCARKHTFVSWIHKH